MKKLLITSFALALGSGCVTQYIGFRGNELTTNNNYINQTTIYDPLNLSTWGDQQKAIIVKSYLATAKYWYQSQPSGKTAWYYWELYVADLGGQPINNAFKLVSPQFWTGYVFFTYKPYPSAITDLSILLKNGVHFYMHASPGYIIKGKIDFVIKGNI